MFTDAREFSEYAAVSRPLNLQLMAKFKMDTCPRECNYNLFGCESHLCNGLGGREGTFFALPNAHPPSREIAPGLP